MLVLQGCPPHSCLGGRLPCFCCLLGGLALVDVLSYLGDLPIDLVDLSLSAVSRLSGVAERLIAVNVSAPSCNSLLASVI